MIVKPRVAVYDVVAPYAVTVNVVVPAVVGVPLMRPKVSIVRPAGSEPVVTTNVRESEASRRIRYAVPCVAESVAGVFHVGVMPIVVIAACSQNGTLVLPDIFWCKELFSTAWVGHRQ